MGASVKRCAVAAGAAAGVYGGLVRPWMLHWGARPSEVGRGLPGDHLVPHPKGTSTRAIAIDAPVEAVWPWLVQIGQDRGGFYSYDWLENLVGCRMRNADRIVPEWQHVEPGDQVRLAPAELGGGVALEVAVADAPFALVLGPPGTREAALAEHMPWVSWAFVLVPITPHSCRLIVRWRTDYRLTASGVCFNQVLLEPIHFVMERKMLRGIKARAERDQPSPAQLRPSHAA